MKNPKITTVIPTYNRPDLLARAIKSVQLQEFEDWELIVFSDHCPKAHMVYETYFKDDDRILFIENPNEWVKNVGSIGVNYALKNAKSNIITYLCDDNIFLPNHLNLIYNTINQYDNVDYVKTNAYHIHLGEGDGKIRELLERGLINDINSYYNTSAPLGGNVTNCPSDMLLLGHTIDKVVDSVGYWVPWNESGNHNEDGDFMIELNRKFSATSIPNYTAVYYSRRSALVRDEEYHSKVNSLTEDEIFVYPKLIKDFIN